MAKAIMIQGTMSNAGKSFLTAALLRIFKQDGYRCAPFKSQNMALNSYITREGLEIGRAQAMQAEAAGVEPSVSMNPILLKPTTDMGSQVIVNGEVFRDMEAADYYQHKAALLPYVMEAYRTLERQYDIIVIEGAGSPVELNLKKDDFVNMGMAKLVKAPVLLVGDIDRGGIFAQLLGTLSLLEKDELALVKGLLVNKFRGDSSLFADGVRILEERGEKPVAGVVPCIRCDIDEEDSLSGKLEEHSGGIIDIAVIRFRKISNFTDFDVFSQYEGVTVRYVSRVDQLKEPDLILLPGTKNTISDLKWLRESGLEAAVKKCVSAGTPVFGVCGGYQMLGQKVSDPEFAEEGGEIRGMGLLDMETVFHKEKTRTRIKGKIHSVNGFFSCLSGAAFEGYEIHMGRTQTREDALATLEDGRMDGAFHGNVYGSYVHGIFDSKEVSGRMVQALYQTKGLKYGGTAIDRKAYKETQYEILADGVRQSVDMDLIYRILKEGV